MVDGCAICGTKTAETEVSIALVNTWPAGSLFTKCKEKKHEAGFVETPMYFQNYVFSAKLRRN
jgi:hypothetical protein